MNGVNFIPAHRRRLQARRARFRAWTIGVAGYSVLAALVCTLCVTVLDGAGDDRAMQRKLDQLPGEIDAAQRALKSVQAQRSEAQAKLDAARLVTQQPDWSVLLNLLARSLGEEIVLTSCRLDAPPPVDAARPQSAAERRGGTGSLTAPAQMFTLTISGIGQTQTEVSQFVLRLEQLGLFERVSILKTRRQTYRDREAIAFDLEAAVGPAGTVSAGALPRAVAGTSGGENLRGAR